MTCGWRAAALVAALSFVALGCSRSSAAQTAPASSRPTGSSTTRAPTTTTTTTLGTLPPRNIEGLHITRADPPAGLLVPRAVWLRVTRPDGRGQLVSVMRPHSRGRHPVVVYLHGSSGLEVPELVWARALADRGYVVVTGCYLAAEPYLVAPENHFWVPCRGLPDSEHSSPAMTNRAYKTLLDVATALPDAKSGRLGVFGVSLGGIVALSTREPRVKVIVADSSYGKSGAEVVGAPVLLLGLEVDAHVDHSRVVLFEQVLRNAHRPVESHYYAGTGHAVTLGVAPPERALIAADSTRRAVAFLRRYLGS